MAKRVGIIGVGGRMGNALLRAIDESPDLTLASALDRAGSTVVGQDAGTLIGGAPSGVFVGQDLDRALLGLDVAATAHALAIAAEGRWPGVPPGKPFRLVAIGDGDFASNSFFPYMSNSDFALAALAWLVAHFVVRQKHQATVTQRWLRGADGAWYLLDAAIA